MYLYSKNNVELTHINHYLIVFVVLFFSIYKLNNNDGIEFLLFEATKRITIIISTFCFTLKSSIQFARHTKRIKNNHCATVFLFAHFIILYFRSNWVVCDLKTSILLSRERIVYIIYRLSSHHCVYWFLPHCAAHPLLRVRTVLSPVYQHDKHYTLVVTSS